MKAASPDAAGIKMVFQCDLNHSFSREFSLTLLHGPN